MPKQSDDGMFFGASPSEREDLRKTKDKRGIKLSDLDVHAADEREQPKIGQNVRLIDMAMDEASFEPTKGVQARAKANAERPAEQRGKTAPPAQKPGGQPARPAGQARPAQGQRPQQPGRPAPQRPGQQPGAQQKQAPGRPAPRPGGAQPRPGGAPRPSGAPRPGGAPPRPGNQPPRPGNQPPRPGNQPPRPGGGRPPQQPPKPRPR